METTKNIETLKAVRDALQAEVTIAFIQRTDSPAKLALWEYKVDLLDTVCSEIPRSERDHGACDHPRQDLFAEVGWFCIDCFSVVA